MFILQIQNYHPVVPFGTAKSRDFNIANPTETQKMQTLDHKLINMMYSPQMMADSPRQRPFCSKKGTWPLG